jgi:histidyl-tRNA synthetase
MFLIVCVFCSRKETEGLDVNAAFVSKAIKKAKNITIIPEDSKTKQDVKDINHLVKKAQEYENSQHFKEAVQYLSDAINLKPQSIDLILKRSYLYFELAKFEK